MTFHHGPIPEGIDDRSAPLDHIARALSVGQNGRTPITDVHVWQEIRGNTRHDVIVTIDITGAASVWRGSTLMYHVARPNDAFWSDLEARDVLGKSQAAADRAYLRHDLLDDDVVAFDAGDDEDAKAATSDAEEEDLLVDEIDAEGDDPIRPGLIRFMSTALSNTRAQHGIQERILSIIDTAAPDPSEFGLVMEPTACPWITFYENAVMDGIHPMTARTMLTRTSTEAPLPRWPGFHGVLAITSMDNRDDDMRRIRHQAYTAMIDRYHATGELDIGLMTGHSPRSDIGTDIADACATFCGRFARDIDNRWRDKNLACAAILCRWAWARQLLDTGHENGSILAMFGNVLQSDEDVADVVMAGPEPKMALGIMIMSLIADGVIRSEPIKRALLTMRALLVLSNRGRNLTLGTVRYLITQTARMARQVHIVRDDSRSNLARCYRAVTEAMSRWQMADDVMATAMMNPQSLLAIGTRIARRPDITENRRRMIAAHIDDFDGGPGATTAMIKAYWTFRLAFDDWTTRRLWTRHAQRTEPSSSPGSQIRVSFRMPGN